MSPKESSLAYEIDRDEAFAVTEVEYIEPRLTVLDHTGMKKHPKSEAMSIRGRITVSF